MEQKKRFTESYLLIVEAVIFFGVGFGGRALLDRLLAAYPMSPPLVTGIKIVLFLGFVLLAIYVDRLVNRYLKSKGWVD